MTSLRTMTGYAGLVASALFIVALVAGLL